MNWVDFVIVATFGISILIGLMRGFTREALSLVGWIVAIWVTLTFSDALQEMFVPYVELPPLRIGLAVVTLFVVTLVLAALVNHLAREAVERTGLTGTDRAIGVTFGFARGFALITIVALLGGLTDLPHETSWRESLLMYYFQGSAIWLRDFLPPEVAASVRY